MASGDVSKVMTLVLNCHGAVVMRVVRFGDQVEPSANFQIVSAIAGAVDAAWSTISKPGNPTSITTHLCRSRIPLSWLERFAHGVGLPGDDHEVSARRLVRLDAALLPIAQRTERDVVARCEVFLA